MGSWPCWRECKDGGVQKIFGQHKDPGSIARGKEEGRGGEGIVGEKKTLPVMQALDQS